MLVSLGAVAVRLLFAIAVGLGPVLQARYRDIREAAAVHLPGWFLMTPVVYPMSEISPRYAWIVASIDGPDCRSVQVGHAGQSAFPQVPAASRSDLVVITMLTASGLQSREAASRR